MQTVMIHYNQDPVRPLLWSNWIDLVAPRALFTAQSYSMQLTVEMCERTVVTLARGPRSYEEAICLTHSARTHTQVQIGSADSNQSSSFIGWATGGKKDKIASKKERQRETETNTETQTEAVMKAEVKRVRGEKKEGQILEVEMVNQEKTKQKSMFYRCSVSEQRALDEEAEESVISALSAECPEGQSRSLRWQSVQPWFRLPGASEEHGSPLESYSITPKWTDWVEMGHDNKCHQRITPAAGSPQRSRLPLEGCYRGERSQG